MNFPSFFKKKAMRRKVFLIVGLILGLVFLTQILSAQPPPPDPQDIPIDGGLFVLLAAGLIYGAKEIHNYDGKKKKD